jgi:hypothetical protein
MDATTVAMLLSMVQALGVPAAWITTAVTVCAALAMVAPRALPWPKVQAFYGPIRAAVDVIGLNMANARNAPALAAVPPPAPAATPPRYTLCLALLAGLLLAGCTVEAQSRAIAITQVACAIDGTAQPILVSLAPLAGPGGVEAATVDTALVHPIVVAACASVSGAPAGVVARSAQ